METVILSRPEVASLLRLDDCIPAVEDAFRQQARGAAIPPVVLSAHAPEGAFHVKAAGVERPRPVFAAKINANFRGNPERHGLPTIQGVIVLSDLATGSVLAVLDSIEITIQRTAAATGVAANYLARRHATVISIVGCGAQAAAQVRAVCAVRPITAVHAFDIDANTARRFVTELETTLRAQVRVAPTLGDALRQGDIVVTCTTSRRPIVHRGDVQPGALVAAVGADNPEKQEIEPALLASATVVVDVLEQCVAIGDLHHAVAEGHLKASDVYAELGQIVSGQKPGRRSDDEIIVFDSTGMALQDVVTSALVYERALERGVGQRLAING